MGGGLSCTDTPAYLLKISPVSLFPHLSLFLSLTCSVPGIFRVFLFLSLSHTFSSALCFELEPPNPSSCRVGTKNGNFSSVTAAFDRRPRSRQHVLLDPWTREIFPDFFVVKTVVISYFSLLEHSVIFLWIITVSSYSHRRSEGLVRSVFEVSSQFEVFCDSLTSSICDLLNWAIGCVHICFESCFKKLPRARARAVKSSSYLNRYIHN